MKLIQSTQKALCILILTIGILAATKVFVPFPEFPALDIVAYGIIGSTAVVAQIFFGKIDDGLGAMGLIVIIITFCIGIVQMMLLKNSATVGPLFLIHTVSGGAVSIQVLDAMKVGVKNAK